MDEKWSLLHLEKIIVQVQQTNLQLYLPTSGIFAISYYDTAKGVENCDEVESSSTRSNENKSVVPYLLLEVFVQCNLDNNLPVQGQQLYHVILSYQQIQNDISKIPKATLDVQGTGSNNHLTSDSFVNQLLSLLQINNINNVDKNDRQNNTDNNADNSKIPAKTITSETSTTTILDSQQDITVKFEVKYDNDQSKRTVSIQVSHRLKSGIVLSPWSTCLVPSIDTNDIDRFNTSAVLGANSTGTTFIHRLVNNHFVITKQIQEQTNTILALEKAHDAWKDTANLLEEKYWQKEKNDLLNNFLHLYQSKHTLMTQQDATIEQLQQKVQSLEETLAAAKNASSSIRGGGARGGTRKKSQDEKDLESIPDDCDNEEDEVYDPYVVEALAAGRKLKRITGTATSRKKIVSKKQALQVGAAKKRRIETDSDHEDQRKSLKKNQERKRRNNTTGAIEYYDTNALFEDETIFQNKTSKDATMMDIYNKSQTNDINHRPDIHIKTENDNDQNTKRKHIWMDDNDDDSSTDSDTYNKCKTATIGKNDVNNEKSEVIVDTSLTESSSQRETKNDSLHNNYSTDQGKSTIVAKQNNLQLTSFNDSSDDDDLEATRKFFLSKQQETEQQHQQQQHRKSHTIAATSLIPNVDNPNQDHKTKKNELNNFDTNISSIDQDLQDDILAQLEAMKN